MPSFNVFGGVTGRNSATLFEIRLENEIIVLRGGESEASSQMLKGVVVLCLPSALKVEDVHLRMTGQLRVGWNDQRITPTGISNNRVDKATEIFTYKWSPFVGGTPGSSSRGTLLPSGNYEWPFELVIPGGMAESVEGLQESHIMYKLKATVARGKLAYDLHAHKPVRIVRTLDPSALELAHAMTVENVWPNKIEYQLVIPQKAIIFGTAIDVEMRFTSLLKGLRIGNIKCQLIEAQEFTIAGSTANSERFWKHQRDIRTWTFKLNDEDHYHDMLDDSGQDGYTLHEKMPLPKKLSKCLQDVDVHGIKIRHKVKFNIALHNPDGHVSELRATLPVTIFISPNMPLTSDGRLVDQTPMSTQSTDIVQHAPPLYGEHVLDQLYADVDQSGMMTPAPQSGMNTPFYNHSQTGSAENLTALTSGPHPSGAVPPAALSSRLQDLNLGSRNSSFRQLHQGGESGGNTPHSQPHTDGEAGYFDHSGSNSNPLSRRTSEEEGGVSNMTSGQHSPQHIDFSELGDLTKVPSYRTAVQTPMRSTSYNNAALPNYEAAVSARKPPKIPRSTSTVSTSTVACLASRLLSRH
ncbi:carbon catabolite repression protein-like protein cred [Hyaloscypha sp. PMI_1271]|nr:carbon catabolite repression protein-like protein cred [Hyaloscypha sp. PMI_1271]